MTAVLSNSLTIVAPIFEAQIVWDASRLLLQNTSVIPPAQQATGTGTRAGTVRYANGALAAGVRVLMQDKVSGAVLRTTITDSNGRFTFSEVNADLEYVFTAIDKEPKASNAGVVDESAPPV